MDRVLSNDHPILSCAEGLRCRDEFRFLQECYISPADIVENIPDFTVTADAAEPIVLGILLKSNEEKGSAEPIFRRSEACNCTENKLCVLQQFSMNVLGKLGSASLPDARLNLGASW